MRAPEPTQLNSSELSRIVSIAPWAPWTTWGLQWTRHRENSSHVTSSHFHQKVNSSQWTRHKDCHRAKWTRHTVISSHLKWKSELVTCDEFSVWRVHWLPERTYDWQKLKSIKLVQFLASRGVLNMFRILRLSWVESDRALWTETSQSWTSYLPLTNIAACLVWDFLSVSKQQHGE